MCLPDSLVKKCELGHKQVVIKGPVRSSESLNQLGFSGYVPSR